MRHPNQIRICWGSVSLKVPMMTATISLPYVPSQEKSFNAERGRAVPTQLHPFNVLAVTSQPTGSPPINEAGTERDTWLDFYQDHMHDF